MKRTKKSKPAPPDMTAYKGTSLIAFDLSLTSTGWAYVSDMGRIMPGGFTGLQRLDYVFEVVTDMARHFELVVMEGLSMASNYPGASERIGLAYMVRHWLWKNRIPFILVPPMTLKKFATGKGNADKDMVIKEVYKRWGHDCTISDEADACAALHFGLQLIGSEEPQNAIQRECLTKCEVVMPEGQ